MRGSPFWWPTGRAIHRGAGHSPRRGPGPAPTQVGQETAKVQAKLKVPQGVLTSLRRSPGLLLDPWVACWGRLEALGVVLGGPSKDWTALVVSLGLHLDAWIAV